MGGMAIALLADIHANLPALRACLAHARAQGASSHAFLGDLVGYGAEPAAVLDIIAEHAAAGAVVVKGNHDAAITGSAGYFNEAAKAAITWTRGVLAERHRAFIDALPFAVSEGDAFFVHASAAFPERWTYIDGPDAAARSTAAAGVPYTFCGHVHEQVLYAQGTARRMLPFRPRPGVAIPIGAHRAWLAIVGSVGQPRDGNPAACYALADLDRRVVTFHRVAYDHHEAARRIRAAGLPEMLAYRLEKGV
jgi:diadenosine tetraphosphatase ApaH/serine/threonine PP2A family protein phosphatase